MKKNLTVRYIMTHNFTRRLGRVYFVVQYFAKPGSNHIQAWQVNYTHLFKKWKDAHTYMISEADRIGGGDCTRKDNNDEATTKEIYTWEKDVALS